MGRLVKDVCVLRVDTGDPNLLRDRIQGEGIFTRGLQRMLVERTLAGSGTV